METLDWNFIFYFIEFYCIKCTIIKSKTWVAPDGKHNIFHQLFHLVDNFNAEGAAAEFPRQQGYFNPKHCSHSTQSDADSPKSAYPDRYQMTLAEHEGSKHGRGTLSAACTVLTNNPVLATALSTIT